MTKTEMNRTDGVFGFECDDSNGKRPWHVENGHAVRSGRVKIARCEQGHRIDAHNTIIYGNRRCCLICFREKHPGNPLLAALPPAPTTRCSHGAFGYCALCERVQANNGTRVEL